MRERLSAEELVALGEQIAEQAVHLDAAMHRLLADLQRFDEAGGWLAQGFATCAHWLSHRVGWDLATSRERIRVARSLAVLPEVAAALASGKLSYSKARAITRVATPVNEPTLLQYAEVSTASQLETICRKFHAAERIEANAGQPLPRDDDRYVVASAAVSGLVCVKAFLLPDEAALLLQAIQQAARQGTRPEEPEEQEEQEGCRQAEPAQGSRAGASVSAGVSDGLSIDSDSAPAASVAERGGSERGGSSSGRRIHRADGLMALVHAYVRGGRPNRSPIEMIVTAPAEALRVGSVLSPSITTPTIIGAEPGGAAPAEALRVGSAPASSPAMDSAHAVAPASTSAPAGDSTAPRTSPEDRGASIPVAIVAETDTYLSREAVRRLACDCGLVHATVDAQGQPLSVGRKTRTIPAAIKRALLLRDRTCRFPGCDHRLFLDGDHLQHWADGGETSLRNIALLCSTHHARVHEHGYRIVPAATGELTFLDSRGKPVIAVPPRPMPPELGWPAIRAANAAHAADASDPLSAETSVNAGRHGRLDVKEAVGRLFKLKQRDHDHAHEQTSSSAASKSSAAPAARLRVERTPTAEAPYADEPRRRNDDFADPDYDFVAAGHRADDLLEWSMDELRANGVDPMAQVPAPIWPPPAWYESKQRAVPGPARALPKPARAARRSRRSHRAMDGVEPIER